MWTDMQEAFFIAMGPFIADILLPLFVGGGLALAVIEITSRFWRSPGRVRVVGSVKLAKDEDEF